jgi:hypothetical protein
MRHALSAFIYLERFYLKSYNLPNPGCSQDMDEEGMTMGLAWAVLRCSYKGGPAIQEVNAPYLFLM